MQVLAADTTGSDLLADGQSAVESSKFTTARGGSKAHEKKLDSQLPVKTTSAELEADNLGSVTSSGSDDSTHYPESPTTPLPVAPSGGLWGMIWAWIGDGPAAGAKHGREGPQLTDGRASRPEAPFGIHCKAGIWTDDMGEDENVAGTCCSARANQGRRPKHGHAMLQMMRSACVCSEEAVLACAEGGDLQAAWLPQYEAAARFLQTCLNAAVRGPALRIAIADAYGSLHAAGALRRAALADGRVEAVAGGALFRPEQRLFLWLGGVRPTDMLACARIRMAAAAEALAPAVLAEVEALQTACRSRQAALSRGFDELHEKLARATAVSELVAASRRASPGELRCVQPSMIHGIRGAMASMLIQADELRARLLEQLAVLLAPQQLALVLLAPLTMLAKPT